MLDGPRSRRLGVVWVCLVLAVVLGLVVVVLLMGVGEEAGVGEEGGVGEVGRVDGGGGVVGGSVRREGRRRRFPKIDRRTRAVMLQKILMALQEKRKIESTAPAEKSRVPGTLPKGYISEKIHEIIPLVQECYEVELEDRGRVSGKVVMEIGFVGDEEYGGLVEEVNVLESKLSRERSESFLECLRESLYAIRLDAPEWGGRQTVQYPFVFNVIGF